MKINYNAQGKARGKLANIIAETINAECTYMKAPTHAYQVGDFTITREGILEFDSATIDEMQIKQVIQALEDGGFKYDGSESLAIGYPLEGFTPQALENLKLMIKAKETLIMKALDVDSLPIETSETELTFAWFKAGLPHSDVYAYSQFITALCKTAKAKKRVTAQPKSSYDSERFSMRVFMISLDMKGAEFDYARKLMMRNLEGSSASPNANGESKPRGERVEKQVLSVRFTPEMLDRIAELAGQSGMSRNALIESIICEHVNAELPETETPHEESADE